MLSVFLIISNKLLAHFVSSFVYLLCCCWCFFISLLSRIESAIKISINCKSCKQTHTYSGTFYTSILILYDTLNTYSVAICLCKCVWCVKTIVRLFLRSHYSFFFFLYTIQRNRVYKPNELNAICYRNRSISHIPHIFPRCRRTIGVDQ